MNATAYAAQVARASAVLIWNMRLILLTGPSLQSTSVATPRTVSLIREKRTNRFGVLAARRPCPSARPHALLLGGCSGVTHHTWVIDDVTTRPL